MFDFLKRRTTASAPAVANAAAEGEFDWLGPHIITRLRAGVARTKEASRKAAYERGYNFAAGALLRGEESVRSLEERVYSPFPQNEQANEFDRGVRDAIFRLVRANVVEDNSY